MVPCCLVFYKLCEWKGLYKKGKICMYNVIPVLKILNTHTYTHPAHVWWEINQNSDFSLDDGIFLMLYNYFCLFIFGCAESLLLRGLWL